MSRRPRGPMVASDEDYAELPSSPSPAGGEAADQRYLHLVERAGLFIREQGGAVAEDVLIGHVFGTMGTPALWRPLLRTLLGVGDDLVLRADGCWAVRGVAIESSFSLLGEFVAVDVETTGLRPLHQRIVEVALIRFRDGLPVE